MMQIRCPWCGPRHAAEFHHHGPPTPRPDVATAGPEQWRRYLYIHANPSGPVTETWYHSAGCRQFFQLVRDTQSNTPGAPEGAQR